MNVTINRAAFSIGFHMAATKQRAGRVIDLLEDINYSVAGGATVDRAASCIRNCKVLTKYSPNKNGMDVEGMTYDPTFHARVRDALESAVVVNIGHAPKGEPDQVRHPREPNGVLMPPSGGQPSDPQETRADWYLNKDHDMTARILTAAESPQISKKQYTLSINARGYGEVGSDRRYHMMEFENPGLRCADLVTRGGAVINFLEERETMTTKQVPFKEIVARCIAKPCKNAPKNLKKGWTDLLEMYEDMAETKVDDPAPKADAEAEDMDWKAHLGNLLKAIANDPEMEPEMIRSKITAALKCLDEGEDKGTTDDEEEGEDVKDKGEEKKKEAMEAAELQRYRAEKGVINFCEQAENGGPYQPTSDEVDALIGVTDEAKRRKLVKKFKTARGEKAIGTSSSRDVVESRETGKDKTANLDFSDRDPEKRDKRLAAFAVR